MSHVHHRTFAAAWRRKGASRRRRLRHLAAIALWTCFCGGVPPFVLRATAREAKLSVAAPLSEAVVYDRANALIAQMTPEEKAGQLSQFFLNQAMPSAVAAVTPILERGAAGSLLFVSSAAETNRLQRIAMDNSRLKIP